MTTNTMKVIKWMHDQTNKYDEQHEQQTRHREQKFQTNKFYVTTSVFQQTNTVTLTVNYNAAVCQESEFHKDSPQTMLFRWFLPSYW